MSPSLLRDIGEALYGPRFASDLARDLAMSDRHMRRLLAGDAAVTEGIAQDVAALLRRRLDQLEALIARIPPQG